MNITRRRFVSLTAGAAAALNLGRRPLLAESSPLVKKPVPSSGELLTAVGLGTNRYVVGEPSENDRLAESLTMLSNMSGQVIDTAPMYRSSETILGQLIAGLELRDSFFIATKSDRDVDDGGIERLENSFNQLRTNTIDLVQSHNLLGAESMLPVLRSYREEGRIRYIGITTSRSQQFPDVLKWMRSTSLDFVQVNYSLADREAAEEILPLAEENGIAVLVNLPFGRGALFKAVGERPLPDFAAEFDCNSWAQFFLKYVISHPAVTCAIPGMTKAHHVQDNLGAARGRLPAAAQRLQMEKYFAGL